MVASYAPIRSTQKINFKLKKMLDSHRLYKVRGGLVACLHGVKQTKTVTDTKRAAYGHTETRSCANPSATHTSRIATTEWKTNTKLALF